ncbi:ABC transporter substrate-binding protein [Antribacter gilvus]|uniref:ABC transporter substrate-binding protein n=1 Tax=Antribacter gilvus TaxID=2304675 RepID=UPI00197FB441|nr:ABC transporter substrate-binding protein [Antribacter gilvus]
MLRRKLAGTLTALAMAGTLGLLPAAAASAATVAPAAGPVAAAPAPVQTTQAVTGTFQGAPFVGEISNLTADVVDGALTLTGTLTGTGLPAEGVGFTSVVEDVQADQACDILNLDLGPLHLDLLGLVVDLEPVVLDVTAVPGPGNLLGNLLCSVAGLLDRSGGVGGALNGVAALLNRLLTGLGL